MKKLSPNWGNKMTAPQYDVITKNLAGILRFYQAGRAGCPKPPTPGGFAARFKRKYPDLYEQHKEVIHYTDALVMAAYNAGAKKTE